MSTGSIIDPVPHRDFAQRPEWAEFWQEHYPYVETLFDKYIDNPIQPDRYALQGLLGQLICRAAARIPAVEVVATPPLTTVREGHIGGIQQLVRTPREVLDCDEIRIYKHGTRRLFEAAQALIYELHLVTKTVAANAIIYVGREDQQWYVHREAFMFEHYGWLHYLVYTPRPSPM